jgi:DNA-binding MarR family transcriptional regulator
MLTIMANGPASTSIRTGDLASQLRLAVMRLSRRLRQHAPEDITQSQLSALAVLVRDGRLTITQLADAERVQPPTITRVVDSLVTRGLAARTVDEGDRRVVWVAPTSEGRALVEATRRRRDAYLARHLRTLSPGDLELLAHAATLLERLTEDPRP